MKALEPSAVTAGDRPAGSPDPAATGPEPFRKRRILLADDSPEIRESVGKLLRRMGYDVAFAAHGGHVLDRALTEPFDLLLLDLNMPQMDGWDALDHLARMKPELPVIVITAQPHQREWVTNAGARALMEKPLDIAVLLQMIEDFIRQPSPEEAPSALADRPRDRSGHGFPRRRGQGGAGVLRGGINE